MPDLREISPRRDSLDRRPNLVDRLYDFFRQGSCAANLQVLLQLRNAAGADDNGVTVLARQSRVVDAPSQSGGMSSETVFLGCILNFSRRLEYGIFVVAFYRVSVQFTRPFSVWSFSSLFLGPGLTGRINLASHVFVGPTTA